jgi:hypothetical protein
MNDSAARRAAATSGRPRIAGSLHSVGAAVKRSQYLCRHASAITGTPVAAARCASASASARSTASQPANTSRPHDAP